MEIGHLDIDRLARQFSAIVMDKVIACPEIPGAEMFIQENFLKHKCYINSATPQDEIRKIVSARGLQKYFLAALGSPTSKSDNLKKIRKTNPNVPSTGFLFFGDALSHAILKRPKAGDFRVQEEHGGKLESINLPERAMVDFGLKVIKNLPIPCLYSRIDVVRYNNQFLLMEVELIEPSLYFNMNPKSATRFAKVFDKWHR